MDWHPESFLGQCRAALMDGLGEGAGVVVDTVQSLIDHPCPQFNTGKGGHSPVGGPPYRETGDLQASYHAEPDPEALEVDVGSALSYSLSLELGIGVGIRPHLRRALSASEDAIAGAVQRRFE